MTPEKALDIINKGLEIAQKSGAFTLSDAKAILIALDELKKAITKPQPTKEDARDNTTGTTE